MKRKVVSGLIMAGIVAAILVSTGSWGAGALLLAFYTMSIPEIKKIATAINPIYGKKNYLGFILSFIFIPLFLMWGIIYRYGWPWAFFVGCNIYLTDAFAMFYGALILPKMGYQNLHLIALEVNERKSWESSVLAVLTSSSFCTLVLYQFMPGNFIQSYLVAWIFSLMGSTGAIMGDLVESWYKRLAKVKDSGKIIGALKEHGGWLDRYDSAIGGATMYLIFLAFKGLFS